MTSSYTGQISPSRQAAFEVLIAVAKGQYASDTLRQRTQAMDGRDAGLASQIVFGVLRYQAQLDYLIKLYSGRQPTTLDQAVVVILRAALFQLRYLERIPPHAAVHEAVELVKGQKRAAAGLVNAILRKVRRQPVPWPNKATELSCPAWLLARWERHFGREAAYSIAENALIQPVPYVRISPGSTAPPMWKIEATSVPGAFRLLSPSITELVQDGPRLHDISSQTIIPLLQLQSGQSYLDLCAAPGNKTRQALELQPGLAVAGDISPQRIRSVLPLCPRVVLDGTKPLPFQRQFDRVFIDAPCSGTGTLGRNPEIKWRVEDKDFQQFRDKQVELILHGLDVLAPGGKLLYATCSLEQEENEDVVGLVQKQRLGVQVEQQIWRIPGQQEGDGFFAALLSSET